MNNTLFDRKCPYISLSNLNYKYGCQEKKESFLSLLDKNRSSNLSQSIAIKILTLPRSFYSGGKRQTEHTIIGVHWLSHLMCYLLFSRFDLPRSSDFDDSGAVPKG